MRVGGGVAAAKLVVQAAAVLVLLVLLAVPVHLLEELASQASTSLLIATCSLGYRSVKHVFDRLNGAVVLYHNFCLIDGITCGSNIMRKN